MRKSSILVCLTLFACGSISPQIDAMANLPKSIKMLVHQHKNLCIGLGLVYLGLETVPLVARMCTQSHALGFFCDSAAQSNEQNDHRPIMLFAHGFGGSATDVVLLDELVERKIDSSGQNPHFRGATFYFPDAGSKTKLPYANLAQDRDIAALKAAIESCPPHKPIILFGHSRGASAIISTLGKHPELVEKHAIRAAIVISPFANLKNVVGNIQLAKTVCWLPGMKTMLTWLASKTVLLDHHVLRRSPLAYTNHIPKNLPILIAHSTQDTMIPCSESKKLFSHIQKTNPHAVLLCDAMNDHNETPSHATCIQAIKSFLAKHAGLPL